MTIKTLLSGNHKLNLAFVAHLFNNMPGLEPLEKQEERKLELDDLDEEEEREKRGICEIFISFVFLFCSFFFFSFFF